MFNDLSKQQDESPITPIVFSEKAWHAMNLEGDATPEQLFQRKDDAVLAALEAIVLRTTSDVQAFYDIEVPCVITTGDLSKDHWLKLRVVVLRTEGRPCGLHITLRDEVHDPEQRVPGLFFPPGQVVATKAVHALMKQQRLDASVYVNRHLTGDWGDLGDEDKQSNEYALEHGLRLFSAYNIDTEGEDKLWIITEADRSCTTLLLPSEY